MRADFPFRPAALPFFYGWVVLVAATLGIVMSVPGQTMGMSVFADPLIAATGLDRLQLSNTYLIGTVASGLLLPWGGTLVDRFGARQAVVAACAGLGLTLAVLAQSDLLAARLAEAVPALPPALAAAAVLAVAFTALRFTGQGMLTLVSRTMLGRWFERRRGLVTAVSGPASNLAFAAAPLLLSLWIARSGWRGAWLEMAWVVGAGMGGVGWLLYRDNPEECGLRLDGDAQPEAGAAAPPPSPRDYTRAEALRTGAFWLVLVAVGSSAMVGTGLVFHIVDLGAEAGLSQARAVAIFLPISIITIFVGAAGGLAVDRVPVRFLIMVMMAGQLLMFTGAARLGDPLWRALATLGWGLSSGFYGPLTVAALPNFFGRAHLGAIQGALMMGLVIASALGPSLLAVFRQQLGSYAPGLHALCALPIAVLLCAPFTRDPARLPAASAEA